LNGAYRKAGSLAAHAGTVYTVAGTSGQATFWSSGSTARENPQPHPVMFRSLLELGSLIVDIDGDRLDAQFLRADGVIDDYFTIRKEITNLAPEVRITTPDAGTRLTGPAKVTIAAIASDGDGTIDRVDFYVDEMMIGGASAAPFSVDWAGGAEGVHSITATAMDNSGLSKTSAAVLVTVQQPSATPPTQLIANVTRRGRVKLEWTDRAIRERRYQLQESRDGVTFKHVATLRQNRTNFMRSRLDPNTTYYFRVRAMNENGSTYSNVVAVIADAP
jgi:hypothetical protein